MDFYQMSYNQLLKSLNSQTTGLSNEDILKQREQYGSNLLEDTKTKSVVIIFISQFKDFLVMILMVAAIISGVMGKIESTLVIVLVLIINALLGTIQNVKAEQSLKSLRALSSPSSKVLRQGSVVEIPSSDIVVGDILLIEAGDFNAAD